MTKDTNTPQEGHETTDHTQDQSISQESVILDPDIATQDTHSAASNQQSFETIEAEKAPPQTIKQNTSLNNIMTKNSQEKFSAVMSNTNYRKFILLVIMLAVSGLIYILFFKSDKSAKTIESTRLESDKAEIAKKSISVTKAPEEKQESAIRDAMPQNLVLAPPAPPPPAPVPPPPPVVAPPPPPPPITNIPSSQSYLSNPFNKSEEERLKKIQARRKAGIMVTGGGGKSLDSLTGDKKSDSKEEDADKDKKPPVSTSGFLGFGEGSLDKNVIAESGAPKVVATKVSDLDYTVLQGKIVDGVLETAINTDIPGTLRAIVARDVYSESGKNILIHKGSRLIGSYQSDVKPGQTRVSIMWDRLIRPDGIDIAISSAGTDQLGRAGTMGRVDTKFWTQITNAFLVSYVIPLGMQKVSGNNGQITTTTNSENGSTTQSGAANDLALQQSASEFAKLAKSTITDNAITKPTITVEQGTVIAIIVQKDLKFPSHNISNKVMQ